VRAVGLSGREAIRPVERAPPAEPNAAGYGLDVHADAVPGGRCQQAGEIRAGIGRAGCLIAGRRIDHG
jgi:hypothetical protein